MEAPFLIKVLRLVREHLYLVCTDYRYKRPKAIEAPNWSSKRVRVVYWSSLLRGEKLSFYEYCLGDGYFYRYYDLSEARRVRVARPGPTAWMFLEGQEVFCFDSDDAAQPLRHFQWLNHWGRLTTFEEALQCIRWCEVIGKPFPTWRL